MLPFEKKLVDELKGQPFALLGINSDGDRSVVAKMLKEQGITWRQGIEGSTQGPLATRFNVQRWPTLYILDKQGNIRYRDLREDQWKAAIEKLLAEK